MSADPFAAISDPNRRFLLEELRRSPKTVNELAAMEDCRVGGGIRSAGRARRDDESIRRALV